MIEIRFGTFLLISLNGFSGILRRRWQPLVKGSSPKIELALHATWISKLNDVKYSVASTLLEMVHYGNKSIRKCLQYFVFRSRNLRIFGKSTKKIR